jgi:uncharacterized protein (DUF1778 family)
MSMRHLAWVVFFAAGVARAAAGAQIQDNSFLVEEAYNQERGVVQHISLFQADLRSSAFLYQFTQEWPLGGIRHQLSYGLGLLRTDGAGGVGLGDTRVNYRYQLVGNGEAPFAVAPRLTVVLPTGDYHRGRGAGAVGVEGWLPASLVLSSAFVVHANVGVTYTSKARNDVGARAATAVWTGAGSAIWLVRPSFNFMLEAVYQRAEAVVAPGSTEAANTLTLSPGIRWSYDFASGLQIVPGIAVPLGVGPTAGQRSILLYLSFEHPFAESGKPHR